MTSRLDSSEVPWIERGGGSKVDLLGQDSKVELFFLNNKTYIKRLKYNMTMLVYSY